MSDDLERTMTRWCAMTDQTLVDFRKEYYSYGPEVRMALLAWVEQLTALPPSASNFLSARVHLDIPQGENTRRLVLTPAALLQAMRAWENGEMFLPDVQDY